jgi:hypothetical protein
VQSCWTWLPSRADDAWAEDDDEDPQAVTTRALTATAVAARALIAAGRAGGAWWCRMRLTPQSATGREGPIDKE